LQIVVNTYQISVIRQFSLICADTMILKNYIVHLLLLLFLNTSQPFDESHGTNSLELNGLTQKVSKTRVFSS
ncbi:19124_t:CDS:1, partial [Gigaspora margarita]